MVGGYVGRTGRLFQLKLSTFGSPIEAEGLIVEVGLIEPQRGCNRAQSPESRAAGAARFCVSVRCLVRSRHLLAPRPTCS
jgi:hypothetical protein